MDNKKNLN